jgi:hypothetical protein
MAMTYDQPQEGMPPDDDRRRKAPTIDLKSTEAGESSPDVSADQPADEASKPGYRPGESVTQSDEPPAAPPPRARRSFPWLSIGAGVVGGAIVAPAILLAIQSLLPDRNERAVSERIGRIEAALRAMPSQSSLPASDRRAIDDIASRVAKLEAGAQATSQQAPDAVMQNRLSGIEGELKALGQSAGALGRRIDEATTIAREARQRADATTPGERSAAPVDPAAGERVEAELASLTARLGALDASQKTFQGELAKQATAQIRDGGARMAASAVALNLAVEQGDAFAPELAAVKSLGADPGLVAPLESFAATGVPTAAALAREFSALKPLLLASAEHGSRNGGFLERLQSNAERLVRIRPLNETAGSDPATALARADLKVAKGDLAGAAAEIKDLASGAPAPVRAWIDKVHARTVAVESSHKLATSALSGLQQ